MITDIEIVEDLSSSARCDEGFLRLKRLLCRNRREDGTASAPYRVDVVDRPTLDAVAVLVYRKGQDGLEVLTRRCLRPAAYFRKAKAIPVPGEPSYLFVEEIVAGVLEENDRGEAGIRSRAAAEVDEEAGFQVRADSVQSLGAAFFVAPGIISEKIFPTAVDVSGLAQRQPRGDGSTLEEGGTVRWWKSEELLAACRSGAVPDAKTEIALCRLLAELRG